MKKLIGRIALISFALISAACSHTQPSVTSSSVENSSAISSESSDTTSRSNFPSTSSGPKIVDNQLSTANGLKVYFKEQGARIDKIEFEGKQIAKDGFTVGRKFLVTEDLDPVEQQTEAETGQRFSQFADAHYFAHFQYSSLVVFLIR